MARSPEHVVETESRRRVASALSAERWVERDQTERDYGIDMTLEHFANGEPSGRLLLLQIKGTDAEPPEPEETTVPFDMKVEHLLRSERFATPVLLVWVPVRDSDHRSWYLWLQGYIRVVLDQENPDWRAQKYVRVHIPSANILSDPDRERLLIHIAGEPARAAAFGQLSRLAHEARRATSDPEHLAATFASALELTPIFGDEDWAWAKHQRGMIEKGLLACNLALRGTDPTDDELKATGWVLDPGGEDVSWEHRWNLLANGAAHCAELISTMVAVYFDDQLRFAVWRTEGEHDF